MSIPVRPGYTPVDLAFINEANAPDLVVNHTLNCCFGVVFGLFNIPLFITLVSTKTFRSKYLLLIFLCLADSSNCLAIFLMGLNRVAMYSDVISSMSIPIRHSWECAMEPWLWFRGIGDLWPPTVQILIGLERAAAVFFPWVYNKIEGNLFRFFTMALAILYVACVLAFGFYLSWQNKDATVKYYCGRKAAFSDEYGHYIYISNIFCYTFGFLVCLCAFIQCSRLKDVQKSNLQRVRYTLVIAGISTLLVSLPNMISLLKNWIPIADAIAKPSVYASSVNSGLNFFVYLILNPEFRERFIEMSGIRSGGLRVVTFESSQSRFRNSRSQ